MKHIHIKILSALALVCFFVACSDGEETVNREEKLLQSFYTYAIEKLEPPIIDSLVVDNLYKLSFSLGDENKKIEKGDSVSFYYVGGTLKSNGIDNIFATNIDSVAQQAGLNGMIGAGVEKVVVGKNKYIKGLETALMLMNDKEHSLVFFSSDLAYGNKRIGSVPPNYPILFELIITKVKKN